MLKTILIIALIAGAAVGALAICAYVLKVEFAVGIMNQITQPFTSLTTGGLSGLNLSTVASAASLATAATSAIGWVKSNKEKALALKDSAKAELENSGLIESVNSLKSTKSQLESQLKEATQIKDDALSEVNGYKSEIAKLKQENSNLQSSLDTLNHLVPKMEKEIQIVKEVR